MWLFPPAVSGGDDDAVAADSCVRQSGCSRRGKRSLCLVSSDLRKAFPVLFRQVPVREELQCSGFLVEAGYVVAQPLLFANVG